MHIINVDEVRDHSYENFQHENLSHKVLWHVTFQIYGIWLAGRLEEMLTLWIVISYKFNWYAWSTCCLLD